MIPWCLSLASCRLGLSISVEVFSTLAGEAEEHQQRHCMISCDESTPVLEENQLEDTGWHRHFSTSGTSRFGGEFGISKLGPNTGRHTSPAG